MNKIKFVCLALISVLLMASCEDNTGNYVDQLYTNSQKRKAVITCLQSSLDTATKHLCVLHGFSNYANGIYRIDFENLNPVFDTLNNMQMGYLKDTLINRVHLLAEGSGTAVRSAFNESINSLEIDNLDALIQGDESAITDYFEREKSRELKAALQSPVSIRMGIFHVNEAWEDVVSAYYERTHKPITVDVQSYIIDKMMSGLLEEMRLEEYNIRTDSTHRGDDDALLGR